MDVYADFDFYGRAQRDRDPFLHPHIEPDPDEYRRAFDGDTHFFNDPYKDVYTDVDVVTYGVFDLDSHTYQHPHGDRYENGSAQFDADSDVHLDGCAAYRYGYGHSYIDIYLYGCTTYCDVHVDPHGHHYRDGDGDFHIYGGAQLDGHFDAYRYGVDT